LGKNPDMFFTPLKQSHSKVSRQNTSMGYISGVKEKNQSIHESQNSNQSFNRFHNVSSVS
jgi:hypothetical protein